MGWAIVPFLSVRQGGINLKKALSLFIACFIIMTAFVTAQATPSSISRLAGIGIMQGDENGNFNEDAGVTRAEFCAMIARLRQVEGIGGSLTPVFTDVPESHWAYNSVMALYSMDIINGRSDTVFDPDAGVTFNEAVKILVNALGYSSVAAEAGEYPHGELITASSIGLLKDVTAVDGEITRAVAADLINSALNVYPLKKVTGKDEYERHNATLYDILVNGDDVIEIEGIITATKNLTIENEFDEKLKDGYIKIDDSENKSQYGVYGGLKYKSDYDYNKYLGMHVTGYARYDEKKDIYNIVSIQPADENKIITCNASDVIIHSDYMEYPEDNKLRKVNFAPDVTFVYNGRTIDNPTLDEISIHYGQYRVIENSGDRFADIVFIDEAESFIVEKTKYDEFSSSVYFANKQTYNGSNRFDFDFDDDNKIYDIKNTDGDELSLDDIMPGQGITFIESHDGNYVKIIISDETISGVADRVTYDSGNMASVIINEEKYKLALDKMGKSNTSIEIGSEGIFVLDFYGNIIDISGEQPTMYEYAYVLAAQEDGGLSKTIRLKLLQGTQPTVEETVKNGNTNYTYYFQNDLIHVYECSEKVKFYAQTIYEYNSYTQRTERHLVPFNEFDVLNPYEKIELDDINMTVEDMAGKLIGFTKNQDGKITEIYLFDIPSESSKLGSASFNAKNLSFGGTGIATSQRRGYLMSPQTMYICVPNALTNDDDCYIQVAVGHNTGGHNVYGARISFSAIQGDLSLDEQRELLYSQPVDVVILKKNMDSSNPPNITENADVCMITNVTSVIAESGMDEGNVVYSVEMLRGNELVTEYTRADGQAYNVASNLLPGDLIRYNKDAFGKIAKLESVGRVQGLDDTYYASTSVLYGLVENIEYNFFDYYENIMVDKLTLNLGDDGIQDFNIPVEDGPQVYMYERSRTGWIYPADMEKIMSSRQNVGEASRILAYRNGSTGIKAIVIIR